MITWGLSGYIMSKNMDGNIIKEDGKVDLTSPTMI